VRTKLLVFLSWVRLQSLGERDAPSCVREAEFRVAILAFAPHGLLFLARIAISGRITRAACIPSIAPSTASRCTTQNSPRPMAGAVHGIQNSGDTLDGTNAAQCLMATVRPVFASMQRWSDCHARKYFLQSHPAAAAIRR